MTDVKCRVKSCHYWGRGDVCQADSITVDNNKTDSSFGRMEIGSFDATRDTHATKGHSSSSDKSQACKSEETSCKTFRPKDTDCGHTQGR